MSAEVSKLTGKPWPKSGTPVRYSGPAAMLRADTGWRFNAWWTENQHGDWIELYHVEDMEARLVVAAAHVYANPGAL